LVDLVRSDGPGDEQSCPTVETEQEMQPLQRVGVAPLEIVADQEQRVVRDQPQAVIAWAHSRCRPTNGTASGAGSSDVATMPDRERGSPSTCRSFRLSVAAIAEA